VPSRQFDFVRNPPQRVGELAKALGLEVAVIWGGAPANGWLPSPPRHLLTGTVPLSDTVRDVSLTFAYDVYHERPVDSVERLAAKEIKDFCVFFLAGHQECAAALEKCYGPPQPTLRDNSVRYGSLRGSGFAFFLSDAWPEGRFALDWYRDEPDWNKRSADLAAAVAEVRRQGFASIHPPGSALEVARLLGDPDPVAQSTDVHLSRWTFRVGDIEATLRYGATGGMVDGPMWGRRLGENDTVSLLARVPRGDDSASPRRG